MQYRIISVMRMFSCKKAMERLAREVNEAMQQGWVPTGGLATHRNVFMQAMVKSR